MKDLLIAIIFMAATVFAVNSALADSHKGKGMGKQQHEEMEKAVQEDRKENK